MRFYLLGMVALWLQEKLKFPNWRPKQIKTMPETDVGVWADKNGAFGSGRAESLTDHSRPCRKGGALGPAGKPIGEDLIYTLVRQCGAATGHPELTPHDLRHTCASCAVEDLEQIQLLLGHALIQTTERYPGTKQDLVERLTISSRSDSSEPETSAGER